MKVLIYGFLLYLTAQKVGKSHTFEIKILMQDNHQFYLICIVFLWQPLK